MRTAFGIPVPDDVLARFEAKILPEPNSGCWLWTGALCTTGYGQFWLGGKCRKANRLSYELYVGKIPAGLDIMHSCDVRSCVNPEHLTPGTTLENVQDMWRKGRGNPSSGSRNGTSKLTWDGAQYIRGMVAAGYTYSQIARRFEIDRTTVSRIANNTAWLVPERRDDLELPR